MLTVYARKHVGGDVLELVSHDDGRVGIWSPVSQSWAEMWGNGLNQAGFRSALADWDGHILPAGEELLAELRTK